MRDAHGVGASESLEIAAAPVTVVVSAVSERKYEKDRKEEQRAIQRRHRSGGNGSVWRSAGIAHLIDFGR